MNQKQQGVTASVLIVDDHILVKDLIAGYLATAGQFTVATAGSVAEAVAVIGESGPFDVVLLDLALPDAKGLDGLRDVLAANKGGEVAIFSGMASRDGVTEAIGRGASGYIPKDLPLKSLINAINFILSGETYFPPTYISALKNFDAASSKVMSLKEISVLRGIRSGLMNKQIAREMGLSEVTVKMHVRSICKKLEARNRTHAAMIATSLALV